MRLLLLMQLMEPLKTMLMLVLLAVWLGLRHRAAVCSAVEAGVRVLLRPLQLLRLPRSLPGQRRREMWCLRQ